MEDIKSTILKNTDGTSTDVKRIMLKTADGTYYAWNKPFTATMNISNLVNPVDSKNIPSYSITRTATYEPKLIGKEIIAQVTDIKDVLLEDSNGIMTEKTQSYDIYYGDVLDVKKLTDGDTSHYNYSNLPTEGTKNVTDNINYVPTQQIKVFTITTSNRDNIDSIKFSRTSSPYGGSANFTGYEKISQVYNAGDTAVVSVNACEGYSLVNSSTYTFTDLLESKTIDCSSNEKNGYLRIFKYIDSTNMDKVNDISLFSFSANVNDKSGNNKLTVGSTTGSWSCRNLKYWDTYNVTATNNATLYCDLNITSASGTVKSGAGVALNATRKSFTVKAVKTSTIFTDGTSILSTTAKSTNYGTLTASIYNAVTGSTSGATTDDSSSISLTTKYQDKYYFAGTANTGYEYLGLSNTQGSSTITIAKADNISSATGITFSSSASLTYYPVFKVNSYSGKCYNRLTSNTNVVISSTTYTATYNSTKTIKPESLTGFTYSSMSYYPNMNSTSSTSTTSSSATITVGTSPIRNSYAAFYKVNNYTLSICVPSTGEAEGGIAYLYNYGYDGEVISNYNLVVATTNAYSVSSTKTGTLFSGETSISGTEDDDGNAWYSLGTSGSGSSYTWASPYAGANGTYGPGTSGTTYNTWKLATTHGDSFKLNQSIPSNKTNYLSLVDSNNDGTTSITNSISINGADATATVQMPRVKRYRAKLTVENNSLSTSALKTCSIQVYLFRNTINTKFPGLKYTSNSSVQTMLDNSITTGLVESIYSSETTAKNNIPGLIATLGTTSGIYSTDYTNDSNSLAYGDTPAFLCIFRKTSKLSNTQPIVFRICEYNSSGTALITENIVNATPNSSFAGSYMFGVSEYYYYFVIPSAFAVNTDNVKITFNVSESS